MIEQARQVSRLSASTLRLGSRRNAPHIQNALDEQLDGFEP